MKIVSLEDLFEKTDKESKEKQKRVIEIANLDPNVKLAIRMPLLGEEYAKNKKSSAVDNIWEYDLNLIKGANSEGLHDVEAKDRGVNFDGVRLADRHNYQNSKFTKYYLVLHDITLERMKGSADQLVDFFSSLLRMSADEEVEEITPEYENKDSCSRDSERVFVLCNPCKKDDDFSDDDIAQLVCAPFFLSLCVDLVETNYRCELKEMIPELSILPKYALNKLKNIPRKYKNRPERLECMIEAYRKYWKALGEKPAESVDSCAINNKVESYIRSSFQSKAKKYNGERGEHNKIVMGDKLIQYAAKVVDPSFHFSGDDGSDRSIFLGMSATFYTLICAAEFFWRDVCRDDYQSHPEGKHIEKVLRHFGKENILSLKDIQFGKRLDTTPYKDAVEDYRR
jgi:hypothetical protein